MSKNIEITPEQGFKKAQERVLFVDVREVTEVQQMAYDVARIINIPLSELQQRFEEIPNNEPVVMTCRSGGRSMQATLFLLQKGFQAVNLQGGIIAWEESGFPIK